MEKIVLNVEYKHLTEKEQGKRQEMLSEYYKNKIIREFKTTEFCFETWEYIQNKTGYVTLYELWDVMQMAYSMANQISRELNEKSKTAH